MENYVGLDIGGTKILGALYDETGQILKTVKKKTKAALGIDTVKEQIVKVMTELTEELTRDLSGIGVGVPGLITEDGVIEFSPNIPFSNVDLKAFLSEKYGCDVVVGNDVNVAMYGEWKHLGLSTDKTMLGVFVGTGVGGAIVMNDRLYIGQGSAGEFGHMIIVKDGELCGCGNKGCLEAYASKTAIEKHLIKHAPKSTLAKQLVSGERLKSSQLKKACLDGDKAANEAIVHASKYLGIGIANLINIFHPHAIVIGGGVMTSLGDIMLPMVLEEVKRHTMPGLFETVEITLSQLGDFSGVFGGFKLIRETNIKST